jgi:hypothetical protein
VFISQQDNGGCYEPVRERQVVLSFQRMLPALRLVYQDEIMMMTVHHWLAVGASNMLLGAWVARQRRTVGVGVRPPDVCNRIYTKARGNRGNEIPTPRSLNIYHHMLPMIYIIMLQKTVRMTLIRIKQNDTADDDESEAAPNDFLTKVSAIVSGSITRCRIHT